MDFREVTDALALIRSVPPIATIVPATTVVDPSTGGTVNVPGYTVVSPPLAQLPDALKSADGQAVRLDVAFGLLWGVVWQVLNREQRTAIGRVTVTSGIWLANSTRELTVAWDTTPLALPKDGIVMPREAIAWLGKTTARVKTGSISTSGCVIVVTALAAVTPVIANPVTFEVQAPYDYFPPYSP